MNIVGINAYHGDVSAVLLADGQLVAAVEEERLCRVKHVAGFPSGALRACLKMGGIRPKDVDAFAVSRSPRAHLMRKVLFALQHPVALGLARERQKNQARIRGLPARIASELELSAEHVEQRMHWVEHHASHLASSYLASHFEEAAVCAIDGFGDFVSTSAGVGRDGRLQWSPRVFFPHSLGLLYLAITQYLGFPSYGDEYKVMGLAPLGEPDLAPQIRKLVERTSGGTFRLDLPYFCHHKNQGQMTWEEGPPRLQPVYTRKLEELLGPARRKEDAISDRHKAIAASVQLVFEEVAFHVLRHLAQETGLKQLCLAGGCAMNSVFNGKVRAETPFEDMYVQPASGDNGTALGAALLVNSRNPDRSQPFVMNHAYWGPSWSGEDIEAAVAARTGEFDRIQTRYIEDENTLCDQVADRLSQGMVVGWFQGRMEWGARALGNRSILADPRRADMREIINAKIKFREAFRPFAPSILEESLHVYFIDAAPDPFMAQVYPIREEMRTVIPAVTHVDGTGRVQSVAKESSPRYWKLIDRFRQLTGVPVLLNTSFNENEPIVHTPSEALDCFLRTRMDTLVMGNLLLEKPPHEANERLQQDLSRVAEEVK